MRCDELQNKIAVHDPLDETERRHVAACAECAALARFDEELSIRLQGWRDPGVVPGRRPHPIRSPRWALAGAGLVAALTVAVLALPGPASAKAAYRRMIGRVREVRTVHLVVRWRPGNGNAEDGPMRQTEELWWRPGAWRETWERGRPKLKLAGADGITFYQYDPETRRVESSREVAPQRDYRHFELADFAKDYMAPPARFEQPSPTTLIATNAGDWSRMTFTLDAATGLPTHAVEEHRGRGNVWEAAGELDLRFDEALPDSLFTPEGLRESAKP